MKIKGNYSRPDTFDPTKHYVGVRLQQGVPLVDADWNEQEDIHRFELRSFLRSFIGDGVPNSSGGFEIKALDSPQRDFDIMAGEGDTRGVILVDGLLVFNEAPRRYTKQRLYTEQGLAELWEVEPLGEIPQAPVACVVLDVWEREVDSDEEAAIEYEAIGETCVRRKLEWVVRVFEGDSPPEPDDEGHVFSWLATLQRKGGQQTIGPKDIHDHRRLLYTPDLGVENPELELEGKNYSKLTLAADQVVGRNARGLETVTFDTTDGWLRLGCDGIDGDLIIKDAKDKVTVGINGDTAAVIVGGENNEGDVVVRNGEGETSVHLDGGSGDVSFRGQIVARSGDLETIAADAENGWLRLGCDGIDGDLIVKDAKDKITVGINGETAAVIVGGENNEGDVVVYNGEGETSVHLDGGSGDVSFRGQIVGRSGDLETITADAENGWLRLGCDGIDGDLIIKDARDKVTVGINGETAAVIVGGENNEGDVVVRNGEGETSVHLDGGSGDVTLGCQDVHGELIVKNASDTKVVAIDGEEATVTVGTMYNEGNILVRDPHGQDCICLRGYGAEVEVGASSNAGKLRLRDREGVETIRLEGGSGHIYCTGELKPIGSDYAENFESADGSEIPLGTTVTVADQGKIRPAMEGEEPFGVVCCGSALVGGVFRQWPKKYLRDEFGHPIMEAYQEAPEASESSRPEAETRPPATKRRPKINPEYDESQEYVPREERPEWHHVGLLGQLRIRKGQPVAKSWRKLRDISDNVELWLVR